MKRENSGSSTQYTNNPTKSDLTLAKGTEHESRGSIKNQEENFKKIFNKSETPLQILSSGKNNFKFFIREPRKNIRFCKRIEAEKPPLFIRGRRRPKFIRQNSKSKIIRKKRKRDNLISWTFKIHRESN